MKRIIFIIVLVLTMTGTSAQHITEQEALDRAMLYMSSMNGSKHAPSRGVDSKPESAPVQAESIYAFNLKGGGFIIASADIFIFYGFFIFIFNKKMKKIFKKHFDFSDFVMLNGVEASTGRACVVFVV